MTSKVSPPLTITNGRSTFMTSTSLRRNSSYLPPVDRAFAFARLNHNARDRIFPLPNSRISVLQMLHSLKKVNYNASGTGFCGRMRVLGALIDMQFPHDTPAERILRHHAVNGMRYHFGRIQCHLFLE